MLSSASTWKAFPWSAPEIPISACSGLTSTRTRVRNHREAALYAGPFICGDKTEIGSAASARGPASICHGDATHRYRLARPRNYPRRARILQRTLVIYRAERRARRRVTPSRTSAASSLSLFLCRLSFSFFSSTFCYLFPSSSLPFILPDLPSCFPTTALISIFLVGNETCHPVVVCLFLRACSSARLFSDFNFYTL